jgi:REP element-mobilizing transposase RayT
MRTRRGLPFVCTKYMKLLLSSIISRVQRDHKVVLCDFVWMGNHAHMLVVAKDSKACTAFYGEIQKQLTEAIKKLLDLKYANLWQKNGTSVIQYGDLESAKQRVAYIYANPARANLVNSINDYPGLSSYEAFKAAEPRIDYEYKEEVPWIRAPMITRLPCKGLSFVQDKYYTDKLLKKAKNSEKHELIICPNAWMKCFGISSPEEIKAEREHIERILKEYESEALEKRQAKGWKVKGAIKLAEEAIDVDRYEPKGPVIRIFVYAACKKIRQKMICQYDLFCQLCVECYKRWKVGDYTVMWPPGAFLPAMPPRANWFDWQEHF